MNLVIECFTRSSLRIRKKKRIFYGAIARPSAYLWPSIRKSTGKGVLCKICQSSARLMKIGPMSVLRYLKV